MKKQKAIVLAGSRGIGKAIADALVGVVDEIVATSKKDLDTSDLDAVKRFAAQHPVTDVLVLNTAGPPSMPFEDITEELWLHYFNQLFLSFVLLLQRVQVRDNGHVILISSYYVREPDPRMALSNSLRLAFTSVFKTVSKTAMPRNVSFLNIAPGPTRTDRLAELAAKSGRTIDDIANGLPTKRVVDPADIGGFVRFLVERDIHAMSGVTIPFDMGISDFVL
jgi:3-oxoacyl-[acyl-carrier protein] reductase